MDPTKKVRELRMGFPKTGKTKNVVESYPKPLLLLNFEAGGPDSITQAISYVKAIDLIKSLGDKSPITPITCVDFSKASRKIGLNADMAMDKVPGENFILIINALLDHCPFATIVVDPYTIWDKTITDYIGAITPGLLTEMKGTKLMSIPQWGFALAKKRECITNTLSLNANVVFIGHIAADKDELLGTIRYIPTVGGKLAYEIGAMFSQVLVSAKEGDGANTKYVVYTQDNGLFKNLGARFSVSGKSICGPTFQEIYG